jgi:hypothetical protein
LRRGNRRGLTVYDLAALVPGLSVVWGIAGDHNFSAGSVEFAWAMTALAAVAVIAGCSASDLGRHFRALAHSVILPA